MKTLYETATVAEVKERLSQLKPDSQRLWGSMTPAQAMAHCSAGFDMATGKNRPPRLFIGRLLGGIAKRSLILKGMPMRRNSPTDASLVVGDDRDLELERRRLAESIDGFVAGGPAQCTRHPHFFFGPLTPQEWASLMYQHLDHHLRQFGV